MTPLPGKSRQQVSPEWRRRSLVRVRRPAWAGHAPTPAPEGTPAQIVNSTSRAVSSQTTADDIAW